MNQDHTISDELVDQLLLLCNEENREKFEPQPILKELLVAEERYDVIETLGIGGMKCVSKVLDRHSQRYVAMAKLKSGSTESQKEAFLREARLTTKLDHPNIIRVYEIGVDKNEEPYFTMELKSDEHLGEQIKKTKQQNHFDRDSDRRKVLDQFMKICEAMTYAHSRGVLHLDLKPENIHVGTYGEVLICDWGLAQIMGDFETQSGDNGDHEESSFDLLNNFTQIGKLRGTPGYMSPEQIKSNGDVDTRSDVYALGCILATMLIKAPLLQGDSVTRIDQTLNGIEFKLQRALEEASVPKTLRSIILRATSKEKSDRYPNVIEMMHDIDRYHDGYPAHAENASWMRRFYFYYRRNQKFFLVLSCIGILLFVWLNIYTIQLKHSELRERQARQQAELEKDKAQALQVMAEKANDRAKENYLDYVNEVNESRRSLMKRFLKYDPQQVLHLARARTRMLIENGPRNQYTWGDRGDLLFISRNYEAAYRDYKRCNQDWVSNRMEILEKLDLTSHKGRLPLSRLKDLIKALDSEKFLQDSILNYEAQTRRNPGWQRRLVEVAMKAENPTWNGSIVFNPLISSLTISGNGLNKLKREHGHSFQSLKPTEITLENTDVSLKELRCFDFEVLKLKNVKPKDISEIKNLKQLTHLIIEKDVLAHSQITRLNELGIQVDFL